MLSSNTTEERFNSARSSEGRDLYLTEIISDIGEFSHLIDCHGVCGNNSEISFVTNLLGLHATNAGKFRLNMNLPSHRRRNKQAANEEQLYVFILYLNLGKHLIVIRQQTTFLEAS